MFGTGLHQLIMVETYRVAPEDQKREVIMEGTEEQCFGRFLSVCGFSFMDHQKYSYTHYFIEEVECQ